MSLWHCYNNYLSDNGRELVERIDTDGNSGISVEEMVEWMMRLEKAHKTKDLRDFFRESDRNNNGFVTLAEFAHTMRKFGEHHTFSYTL